VLSKKENFCFFPVFWLQQLDTTNEPEVPEQERMGKSLHVSVK
jgi:hypothetical protein